jgi:hypothetical protein
MCRPAVPTRAGSTALRGVVVWSGTGADRERGGTSRSDLELPFFMGKPMGKLPTANSHGACAAGLCATDAAAVGDRLRRSLDASGRLDEIG